MLGVHLQQENTPLLDKENVQCCKYNEMGPNEQRIKKIYINPFVKTKITPPVGYHPPDP